ncbi:MAG: hypothetical protein NC120_06210 [Ruminococcus sp.]|nr:hypothetical protein [Ruminococcus sp.]
MNKLFISAGVIGVLAYCFPTMQTQAVGIINNSTNTEETVEPRTAGLIRKCTLTATTADNKFYLSGVTAASSTMKSIGYKDIVVEYSIDNSHWYTENDNIDDLLISNSSTYSLNNYNIDVKGGYYYRVKLNHYAKESGLFGSSQSVENTSNSVWID